MRHFWLTLLFCAGLSAQTAAPVEQEPPEEDLSVAEKTEYTFNPLQASKEMKVGNFYFKKGSYRAAARRYEEATKWDPNLAEAFLRLGEARGKLGEEESARAAYKKFLKLEPDGKQAASVRKKLGKS